jgi:hypothetical protein
MAIQPGLNGRIHNVGIRSMCGSFKWNIYFLMKLSHMARLFSAFCTFCIVFLLSCGGTGSGSRAGATDSVQSPKSNDSGRNLVAPDSSCCRSAVINMLKWYKQARGPLDSIQLVNIPGPTDSGWYKSGG